MNDRFLYIFLDEAGNFDFSVTGTRYFVVACVTRERPFGDYSDFIKLKYDLIEQGGEVEYFHASEDKQSVRDQVFQIINIILRGCGSTRCLSRSARRDLRSEVMRDSTPRC